MSNIQKYAANDVMPFAGQEPLRRDWIERIFVVLHASFGQQFVSKWAGVSPDEMKALWARKLSQYFDQPQAIRKALEDACDLEFPPSLGEFQRLLQKHYHYERPAVDVEPPGYAEWKAAQGDKMEDRESVIQRLNDFLKGGG